MGVSSPSKATEGSFYSPRGVDLEPLGRMPSDDLEVGHHHVFVL
jgi:hypothetical protein